MRSSPATPPWTTKAAEVNEVKVEDLGITSTDWHNPPPPPRSNYSNACVDVPFTIENSKSESIGTHTSITVCEFTEACPLSIVGDVRIDIGSAKEKEGEELFHFWFHAAMLHGKERLVWRKWMLDGLKDGKHKKFDASFCVVAELRPVANPQLGSKAKSMSAML